VHYRLGSLEHLTTLSLPPLSLSTSLSFDSANNPFLFTSPGEDCEERVGGRRSCTLGVFGERLGREGFKREGRPFYLPGPADGDLASFDSQGRLFLGFRTSLFLSATSSPLERVREHFGTNVIFSEVLGGVGGAGVGAPLSASPHASLGDFAFLRCGSSSLSLSLSSSSLSLSLSDHLFDSSSVESFETVGDDDDDSSESKREREREREGEREEVRVVEV
jgi:hypothetical protein